MNNERTAVEEKKVGPGFKGSVVCHQAEGGCRNRLRDPANDGYELLIDVVVTGVSAALVSDSPCAMNSLRGLSLLQVQDTLTKLHQLAPNYRRLMPRRPFSSFVPAACEKAVFAQVGLLREHKLLTDVVGIGASAALASDSPRAINSLRDLSLLQVQDTLTKLHKLAPSYRRLMPQRPFSSFAPSWN